MNLHSVAKTGGIVVGVLLIFSVGVLVGDGRLRITPRSQYADVTGLPSTLDYSSLNQLYDALRENYDGQLTEAQVIDGLKHGLADAPKDPYTEYFSPSEASAFNGELQGQSISGIGAELDQDTSGDIIVMSPLPGQPAAKAGVEAKDIISTINGQSTSGMSVGDAVDKIRGQKGTKVTLGIIRGSQQLTFTITRDTITIPTATSKIIDGNIGYLQVSQFSDDTYGLVMKAVANFQQSGVKKVILDLRDDPGGEVTSAQDIASLWLNANATIEQEKRGNTVVDTIQATGTDPLKGMPTVVLVDAGSASASEITALALRDNHAATVMGEQTYGKGVVQSIIPFSDGSELKVTIAKWYAPDGENINHVGIKPDQIVSLSADDASSGTDTQLNAAIAYLQSK
ncbi:MAG TPA: S41 family peptidase [Verrucomicrobiae bacterium]|nr:S41 family peptidase [Verrucomicrobiae bacterium]